MYDLLHAKYIDTEYKNTIWSKIPLLLANNKLVRN